MPAPVLSALLAALVAFAPAFMEKPAGAEKPAIRKGAAIALPEPESEGIPLYGAIRKRRSVREYTGEPVDIGELSSILFAGQGITGKAEGIALRAAPSAGALYPIELHVFAHNVKGLPRGHYRYRPPEHSLSAVKKGDFRDALAGAALRQDAPADAAAVIVLTAVPERTTKKYGQRGHRYINIEAGHIAQNMALAATALGLGHVTIGAFNDSLLDSALGIDGVREISVYIFAVGKTN